ncbi:MAG: transposase [Candidatus Acidiferrales bacterium]
MQTFTRKRNRLSASVYQGPRSYFLTLSCHERQKLFLNPAFVQSLLDLFHNSSAAHSFRVCAYCFMPDHFHALVTAPQRLPPNPPRPAPLSSCSGPFRRARLGSAPITPSQRSCLW